MNERRLLSCVKQWPDCVSGDYNPACCRFPKSCSCTSYNAATISDERLEPVVEPPQIAPGKRDPSRKTWLSTAQFALLNDACIPITEAFDGPPYLVGSVTEHAGFRDVDVRVILPDEDFDHWFRGRPMLWSLVSLAIGQHLAALTDLPIDFQIQRMTEANTKHPTSWRHPLGQHSRPYAGGGDATNFGAEA